MEFFDITSVAFKILGYAISYVELIGTLFGFVSVYYAAKANVFTWPAGIINESFLFILFFQVQLYSDMFLQVYFFVITIYGWYKWKAQTVENKISKSSNQSKVKIALAIIGGTFLFGYFFKHIHLLLPTYFGKQAAYPFIDSFIMISSVIANILLARKKIENWYLWIIVDIVSILLFLKRGIYFLSFEYLVFLGMVSYGLFNWRKELIND